MEVYIVINHYIDSDDLKELAINAIKSFRETCDCKIISVDDNSPYDTSFLNNLSDVFIKRETNGGFAVSANDGFRWILNNVKDCYIVYANNDLIVQNGWFEEFKKYVGNGMVAGLGYKSTPPIRRENNISIGGLYSDWMFSGAFYMITESNLRRLGIYDENYKHGGVEDIDLFYRAKQLGFHLTICPNVTFWHKEGATRYSESQKDKQSIHIKENEQYFKDKWGFDPIKELHSKVLTDKRINF